MAVEFDKKNIRIPDAEGAVTRWSPSGNIREDFISVQNLHRRLEYAPFLTTSTMYDSVHPDYGKEVSYFKISNLKSVTGKISYTSGSNLRSFPIFKFGYDFQGELEEFSFCANNGKSGSEGYSISFAPLGTDLSKTVCKLSRNGEVEDVQVLEAGDSMSFCNRFSCRIDSNPGSRCVVLTVERAREPRNDCDAVMDKLRMVIRKDIDMEKMKLALSDDGTAWKEACGEVFFHLRQLE
jgi:hypothetical protein